MDKRKIFVLVSTHLIAALIGAGIFLGWFLYYGQDLLREGNAMFNGTIILSRYSSYLDIQREEASPEEYQIALLGFIEELNKVKELESNFYDKKIIAQEKSITYAKLAKLESNQEKHNEFVELALLHCKESGIKSCAYENIARIARAVEEETSSPKKEL